MDIHLSNVFFISTNTWWLNGNSILSFFMFSYSTKRTTYDLIFFLSLSTNRRHELILNIQRTLPRTVVSPICCVKNRKISTDDILLVVQLASQQGWCSYDTDVVFLSVTPDLLKWNIFLIYRSNMTYETSFRRHWH